MEERAHRAAKKSEKSKKLKEQQNNDPDSEAEAETEDGSVEGSESEEDSDDEDKDYFDEIVANDASTNEMQFSQLNLSRPLLRAVERAGYTTATPIQANVIPIALSGRDICASAVTGSGKTAAFVLPFLERLLYRPKDEACIRVLVITPTRELATQIYDVLVKLSVFTDITSCLICGGKKDIKSQESVLRNRPDVVVCTPGRIIDHLRNSMSISVADLDILVLDEVDRLLELGFQEELEELLKYCPINRQTLLFSATMTTKVEDLIKLSLKRPVRVKVNANNSAVAPRLVQEFVKLRSTEEREAYLCSLIVRQFNKRTICFFETKVEAHRFAAILKLLDIKVTELHGNLPQNKRYAALQDFRDKNVDVMVCTDVAARGLDIPGVMCVINSEMPRATQQYVHRVGRTARAGCGGRSITLVSDSRRKVMKEVLKSNELTGIGNKAPQILTRSIPPSVVAFYISKIASLEHAIVELFQNEALEASANVAERELERAANMMEFDEEIKQRPARTWYLTETQKQDLKTQSTEQAKAESEAVKHDYVEEKAAKKKYISKNDIQMSEKDREKEIGKHRLTRIKKRRLEAMKGLDEYESELKANTADTAAPAEFKQSASVKNQMREKLAKNDKSEQSLAEIAMKSKRARYTKDGLNKVIRPSFATGGLDADMRQWGMLNSSVPKGGMTKEEKALKEFKAFDATKRLGKKKGAGSFKSKAKFKRR